MIAKKVLLVGNFGVGKTSLIKRFVLNEFTEDYISTIGVRVSKKVVEYKNETIKLMIWDVAGTTGNEKIPKAYFLGSSAAMYVFDVSREETYLTIEENLKMVKELSGLQNITIVGNKKDLLSKEELENVVQKVSVDIDLITSAKEDENVEDAFMKLTTLALK
ncbi:GTP-binding protein [Polaribacter sp. Z014]|uniref:Rab family GTPase n=1 Tax=unclassified Polaribacter TaxID=196858 RepID=UPI00193C646C|nr:MULTISPECIES: Rab family GTPase [unclassified Polaribacter]MCL7765231.1 GTP-binding protein [Polaribacter sp. Z014]QVY67036.1 GTP-binding protein [Polaribacter sp. Q13]